MHSEVLSSLVKEENPEVSCHSEPLGPISGAASWVSRTAFLVARWEQ